MKKIMSLALVALLGQSIAQGFEEKIVITIPDHLKAGIEKIKTVNDEIARASQRDANYILSGAIVSALIGGWAISKSPIADSPVILIFGGWLGAFSTMVVCSLLSNDILLKEKAQKAINKLFAACTTDQERELVRKALGKNGIYLWKTEVYS